MIDSVKELFNKRTEIVERIRKEYCPFFDYTIELTRKTVYKASFKINDQERVIRIDPQFPEREYEDVVKEIENVKDAILQTARSAVIKEAKEKLRQRIDGKTYCGHVIRWTYAFELEGTGFTCQEDKLFLPVEYEEVFGENTYKAIVHEDWEDKAEKYFKENVGKQRFYKRTKCPDTLKEKIVEFAAAQSLMFSGHERYICSLSKEIVPENDKDVRYSFEFGDFLEKDGGWEYIKGSGIFDTYSNNSSKYMSKFNAFNAAKDAAELKGLNLSYIEGNGLYNGSTKIRISYGPWYKDVEITPDMEDWECSITEQLYNQTEECKRLVWKKLTKCFDNFLCRDVAELFVVNKKIGPTKSALNLTEGDASIKSIPHSGMYKGYSKEEVVEMIHELVRAKVLKKENYEKDGKMYLAYLITDWGSEMLELYKNEYKENADRINDAIKACEAGNIPCDENAYALYLSIKRKTTHDEKTKELLEKIKQSKNIMSIYEKEIMDLQEG